MTMTTNTSTTNTVAETAVAEPKVRTRTCVEPLSTDEANDLQAWLIKHNFCIKNAKKNIRVYRYLGHKNGKVTTSKDFMYVVGADAYRENKEKVMQDILSLSKKVMNSHRMVKNAEYVEKMGKVEENLLMKHKIQMVWDKSKTIGFNLYNHVITDKKVLAPLNVYVKGSSEHLKTNRIYKTKDEKHLEVFRKMAQIFEEFDPTIPFYDWKSFRYITKGGKVVAAYSMADRKATIIKHFPKGIQDKFDYNLNIMDGKYINEIIKKINDMKEDLLYL